MENQQPSSRWYSGSGIYREVKLLITDLVHLDLYGIKIEKSQAQRNKEMGIGLKTQLESKVSNDGPQSVSVYLEQSIWYDGQQLSDWQATDSIVIESGDKHHFQQAISNFSTLALGYCFPSPLPIEDSSLQKMAFWLMKKKRPLVTAIWIGKRIRVSF